MVGNDFEDTKQILDTLEEMGASNQNIGRLRANIEVLEATEEKSGSETVMERRVARARRRTNASVIPALGRSGP